MVRKNRFKEGVREYPILRLPSWRSRVAHKAKYVADTFLEPIMISLVGAKAFQHTVNYPLETFLDGDPNAIAYASASTLGLAGLSFAEHKTKAARNLIRNRIKKNWQIYQDNKDSNAIETQGFLGWGKTAVTALLSAYLATAPQIMKPEGKASLLAYNIPNTNQTIIDNAARIYVMDHVSEIKKPLRKRKSLEESVDESIATSPVLEKNPTIDAQIYRMTDTNREKAGISKINHQKQKHVGDVLQSYRRWNLEDLGIPIDAFFGLLGNEARFETLISKVGAAGCGQQIPETAHMFTDNVYMPEGIKPLGSKYKTALKKKLAQVGPEHMKKIDHRFDCATSIDMAAQYLQKLRLENPDEHYLITILRYNTGPNVVNNVIARVKNLHKEQNIEKELTVWDIVPYFQEEGRTYPSKVAAMGHLLRSPEEHDIPEYSASPGVASKVHKAVKKTVSSGDVPYNPNERFTYIRDYPQGGRLYRTDVKPGDTAFGIARKFNKELGQQVAMVSHKNIVTVDGKYVGSSLKPNQKVYVKAIH